MGPWSSPPGWTARWTRPFAPKRRTISVSSSISRRVAPAMPGAVIPLTRLPAARVSSNTRKPLAGAPSAPVSAGARSNSSIAKRSSGLSEPKRSIASSYSNTGNGISRIGRSGCRGPRDLDDHVLDEGHDRGLVHEAHLEVELGELRLAVAAQVLVAEAARDLEVAVDARDHEQLLELLGALRKRVDRARLEPRLGR